MKKHLHFFVVLLGAVLFFNTTSVYSISISGSNNAALSSIHVSPVSTLVSTTGPSNINYTTSVSATTTSLTVTPTTSDANAVVKVNNIVVASGSPSQSITLNATGTTTINLLVTAQDGVTTRTTSITVSKTGSSNAGLSSIHLTPNSTLVSATGPANVNYTTSVSSATTSLTVTPTTSDANAVVKVNNIIVASGSASQAIALNATGTTTINLMVTAQDGVTTRTTSITVSKTGSSNAGLSSIHLTPNSTLVSATGPANVNYTTSVSSATTSLTVTPTTSDANAVVKVNNIVVASGAPSQTITLNATGTTIISLLVTAQDGVTTRTTSITVSKTGSSNAGLSSIHLTPNSTLVSAAGPSDINYTTSVSAATNTLTVSPTTSDANAVVKVNNIVVASGSPSQAITLNATGTTTIDLLVTAQDGVTIRTTSITVSKLPSTNAGLSSIHLTPNSTLVSTTGPSNINYTTSVSATTNSVTVTPTTSDANAVVKVNNIIVASGSASQAIALNATGTTTINLMVTAQDGVTTRTTSITVSKTGSSNAGLSSIHLTPNSTLVSATGPANVNYTTSVSSTTTSLTVTPTTSDANAVVKVNNIVVASGSPSQAITLNATGTTAIDLQVTAGDGITIRTTLITVSKTGSNNALLSSIHLSTNSTLVSTTGPSNVNYTASVSPAITTLMITPTASDANAVVKVNNIVVASGSPSQAITLNAVGATTINLLVTAEDGITTRTTSITVSKTGSTNATLSSIYLSTNSTLLSTTGPSNVNYFTSVSPTITTLTVTPTTGNANAVVKVNNIVVASGAASQAIILNATGTTTINLLVTAEDGTTTRTTAITISKTGSNNASLSSLVMNPASTLSTVSGPANVNYTTSVSLTTTVVTIAPTTSDANATVTVDGSPVTSGSASPVIMLTGATTTINLLVTAQDGVTTKSYAVTVYQTGVVDFTWTGAGSNTNWSNNNNWSPSTGHPVAGSVIVIGATANMPTVDVASACATVIVSGTTTLTLSAPLTASIGFTLDAPLTVSGTGGAVTTPSLVANFGGALTNSGTFNVGNGGVLLGANSYINNLAGATFNVNGQILNAAGPTAINLSSMAYISNVGTVNISGTRVKMGASSYINNAAPGIFTINGSSTIDFAGNAAAGAYIYNSGTYYAGTLSSACVVNLNYAGAYVQNTGNFFVGSSSVINLTGSGTLLQNTGSFTLQSDITGSATIGNITGNSASCIGTYKVERYISGGTPDYRSYRLLSSPVNAGAFGGNNIYSLNYVKLSSLITGTNGVAGGFDKAGNPSLYLFRDNLAPSNSSFISGNYRGISDISAAPSYSIDVDGSGFHIPVGNGFLFFFRGDRINNLFSKYLPGTVAESVTMTSTGILNTGQVTVKPWFAPTSPNLDYTAVTGNSSVLGFALVGNPYASSIDWDLYNSVSASTGIYAPNVGPFIYITDPVSKNYNVYEAGFGGFGTIAFSNSNIIPSGQGFFVQANSAAAQLVFNESAKTNTQVSTADQNLFLGTTPPAAVVNQYLHLKLTKDAINTDGTLIAFKSGALPQYDIKTDALYRNGTGVVSLSSTSADNLGLAINTLALPKQTQITIGLNVNAQTDGAYQLSLNAIKSIPDLYDVWLMDAYTKDSLDIKHNPTYSFNILKSDATSFGASRFSLVIRQNPALAMHLLSFTATKITGGSQVAWKTENEANYTNFTVERSNDNGTTFNVVGGFASAALGTYSFLDKTPALGANQYRLKIEDLNGTITYSKVVILQYTTLTNTLGNNTAISIYPNPTANTINLSILQTDKVQSYSIQIVSNTGTVVKSASSKSSSWQTDVSRLLPGTYVISVINSNNNTIVGKSTFVKL